MNDEQKLFDKSVKHKLTTYDNIRKFATSQGDDYTTGCLLDYNFFKNYYKMIAIIKFFWKCSSTDINFFHY